MKPTPTTLATVLSITAILALALTLGAPPAFAAEIETPATGEFPAADGALPEVADLACVLEELEAAELFAPIFLASNDRRSSCTPCSSSAECQPICGGQVGSDFVCHYDWYCSPEPERFCICF